MRRHGFRTCSGTSLKQVTTPRTTPNTGDLDDSTPGPRPTCRLAVSASSSLKADSGDHRADHRDWVLSLVGQGAEPADPNRYAWELVRTATRTCAPTTVVAVPPAHVPLLRQHLALLRGLQRGVSDPTWTCAETGLVEVARARGGHDYTWEEVREGCSLRSVARRPAVERGSG
jgi:hypothetical protein